MKLLFLDALYDDCWDVRDVGAVIVDSADDFKVLGYMGQHIQHSPEYVEIVFEPKLKEVANLIPGCSIQEVCDEVISFVESFLEGYEEVTLVTRLPKQDLVFTGLDDIRLFCSGFYSPEYVQSCMNILDIPSEYEYEEEKYLSLERAVERALFTHAEMIVYRNNIQGWGEDLAKSDKL